MEAYNYRPVDEQLIHELHDTLLTDKSVVLLGPRYGGKRHAMDRLPPLLRASGIEPIVRLRLRSDKPVCTTADMGKLIRQAVIKSDDNGEYPVSEDPFEPLKKLVLRKKKPAILMAANVDGMSHHLARRFIQEIRTLVEAKELLVIMSAESDFRELVHGENSDFSCAEHYVVQGYGLDEFSDFLTTELKYLRIKFAEPNRAYQYLWETTGGNFYILRVLLWTIIQERARSKSSSRPHVSIEEIPSELTLTRIPGAYGAHIFQHAAQLIARDVPCWKQLRELMKGNGVAVQPHDVPTRLELAGIATRRISDGVAELQFSSPVMRAFVEGFYDARRFGDLYASVGDWDKAFERYGQLSAEARIRPSSTDDRPDVAATIRAFSSSLYAEVAGQEKNDNGLAHLEAVSRLFAQGCHYILGFGQITFWQRDTSQQPPEWRIHSPFICDTTTPISSIEQLLPPPWERNLKPGIIESEDRLSKYGVLAVLPSKINQHLIVVLSDFAGSGVISVERRNFVAQVLNDFIGAYRHALEVVNLQVRHRIRQKHDTIIDSLFEELTRADVDLMMLLAKAAKALRQLGYKRVFFSMVNKERTHITGAVDDSDNPTVDLARMSNWPLKKPTADLQPYVIHTKRAKIVKDAREEPLAWKEAVESAGLEALAIVPIINSVGDAIGTIHVERTDASAPSRTEVDDLVFFGRQLAIVIEQLEHLNIEKGSFLQQSLFVSLPGQATSTDSAITKMLETMALLGHKWGRMYLIEHTDNDSLFISKKWHGLTTSQGSEAELDFNNRKVVLAPRSSGHLDWDCIEKGEPIVFCWNKSLADGEKFTSPGGLVAFNWKEPIQPKQIKKEPGDFWIDFPLIHEGQPLGKMCLQLDENVGKRHLELLKMLSANFSAILAANLQRDRDKQHHEEKITRSVVDQTIATMAHNLGTRIGSLPIILDRYRLRTKKYGYKEIEPLNERLQKIIHSAQTAVKRFSLVSEVKPQLQPINIGAHIAEILRQNLPDNTWTFCGAEPSPVVQLDANLFETAFLELVQNSRDAALSLESLRISISLETIVAGEENSVTIIYRDNGPGVPDKYRELIFADFFSHRLKQKLPGTGLGMGFARRVVDAHGGTIFYSGQLELSDLPGAEFRITLPWTGTYDLTEENQDVQNPDSRG